MEDKEKIETSIDYFLRITKNNAINLGRLIEAYIPAKKIYDMEIEKAYADGFLYGREVFYKSNENK